MLFAYIICDRDYLCINYYCSLIQYIVIKKKQGVLAQTHEPYEKLLTQLRKKSNNAFLSVPIAHFASLRIVEGTDTD